MRKVRLLGLALMAIFAFGVVVAATASATEPAGILFLSGETAPVKVEGKSATAEPTLVNGTDTITCTALEFKGELGKEANEAKHATLGSLTVDYTGCKEVTKKAGCRSENAKGEKDPVETILQTEPGTDVHTVSLETSAGKLVPGLLVGLLPVEKKALTLNCGLIKDEVSGAVFLEVVNPPAEGVDVESLELQPNNTAKCDANDKLCKEQLASWGGLNAKKELCPLVGVLAAEAICATFTSKPVKVTSVGKKLFSLDY